MKSNKQRREEIQERRSARKQRRAALDAAARKQQLAARGVLVNVAALAPSNSYGVPDFVQRGYYQDVPFRCASCGRDEVWTATQQKWWYEVAKGFVYSNAKHCRLCRRNKRAASAESRRVHLEGLARKAAK